MATLCATRPLPNLDFVGMESFNTESNSFKYLSRGAQRSDWAAPISRHAARPNSLLFTDDRQAASEINLSVTTAVTPLPCWPSESDPGDPPEASARVPNSRNNSSRYKTELCRPFMETGTCRYGEKCQFAHGLDEKRVIERHPKYKTEQCRTFHKDGFCPYGTRCHFVHHDTESQLRDEANAGTPPSGHAPTMSADSLATAAGGAGGSATGASSGRLSLSRAFSVDSPGHSASQVVVLRPAMLSMPGQSGSTPRTSSRSGRTPSSPPLPNSGGGNAAAKFKFLCTEPSHRGRSCSCSVRDVRDVLRHYSDASNAARPHTKGSPPTPIAHPSMDTQRRYSDASQSARPRTKGSPPTPIGTPSMDVPRRYSDASQSARPRTQGSPPGPIGTPSMDSPRRYSDASQLARPRAQATSPNAAALDVAALDVDISLPLPTYSNGYRVGNDSPMSRRTSRPSGFGAAIPHAQSLSQAGASRRSAYNRSISMPTPQGGPLYHYDGVLDSDAMPDGSAVPVSPAPRLQATINHITSEFSNIWTHYPHQGYPGKGPEDTPIPSSPTRAGHQANTGGW